MSDVREALERIDPALLPLTKPDMLGELLATLRKNYPPQQAAGEPGLHAWDYSGCVLQEERRWHEALAVHWAHYQHLLAGQQGARIHKGTPLVRVSDCFNSLGYRVHAQRYLMLTLCEDAIQGSGTISPQKAGVYVRLVVGGVTDERLQYTQQLCSSCRINCRRKRCFPKPCCSDWTMTG